MKLIKLWLMALMFALTSFALMPDAAQAQDTTTEDAVEETVDDAAEATEEVAAEAEEAVEEATEEMAAAEEEGPVAGTDASSDSMFIFNSLLFLMGGFLVFWMAAGFAMLEAGLVRSKNVAMQLTKNIALFAIAAVAYYIVGYSIMYPGDGWIIPGWFGHFGVAILEPVGVTPVWRRKARLK